MMEHNDDQMKAIIFERLYRDAREDLRTKCEDFGRLTHTLTCARAELYFYQKQYGRIDIWDKMFEARKKLEYN